MVRNDSNSDGHQPVNWGWKDVPWLRFYIEVVTHTPVSQVGKDLFPHNLVREVTRPCLSLQGRHCVC